MTEYRLFIAIGALAAVVTWGANAALLLEMTRTGEINALVFLLFVAAVVALVVAAWRVYRGGNARTSFLLHILFAGGGATISGFFYPRLPLALGLAVAIAALLLSFIGRSAATTGAGKTGETK
jgi:hypothetical protein